MDEGLEAVAMDQSIYSAWQVVAEAALDSIVLEASFQLYPIEIISLVLNTAENFDDDIKAAIRAVDKCCTIHITTGCSTYIYFSPGPRDTSFTPANLVGLAKAIVVFEDAITKIMPISRKKNEFCYSNKRTNPDRTLPYHAVRGWRRWSMR
jgi:hypothetical protein